MKSSKTSNRLMLTIFGAVLSPGVAWAQGVDYVKTNYSKYEYKIPVRDRTRRFTAVYVPKDDSQTYPLLLHRTPYSVRP